MYNRLPLSGTWELAGYPRGEGLGLRGQASNPEVGPIEAQVPGEVHPALESAGLIPDPYYGLNAEEVQWVEEKEWWYTKKFEAPEEFTKKKTFLRFDGLDTFATVWVNGVEVGRTDNMFVPHSFDVTDLIVDGEENTVTVRLEPAAAVCEENDSSPYHACFYQPRVHARKQQCSFGWDWTHRLVGAGITRGVDLVSYGDLAISDLYVHTTPRGGDADAWMYITVDNFSGEDLDAQFVVVAARGEDRERIEFHELIPAEGSVVEAVIRLEDPELWYPNGMGDQPLYVAMVGMSVEGEIQDVREEHFGVRYVELIEEDDNGNPRFILNINGQNVFCKGANWIPGDHFPSQMTPDRYRELLELAVNANMNMLRVWGGGIYEHPIFYRMCDELGIMIWQDFMFACAQYPDDQEFSRKVESEARHVVKALRNHPSIVLWCGNNENEMHRAPDEDWQGKRLFHEVIPGVVKELDGTRPYRPSSPFGGTPANSPNEGDWHGGKWFDVALGDVSKWKEEIASEDGLFVSEFPTQGPPMVESIKSFIPEDQLFLPTLPAWEFHNKDNPHAGRGKELTHTVILADFTRKMMGDYQSVYDFAIKGGVLQGEFLKAEIEHFRRRKYETAGCMYWMYNDCWPAVSLSVVDYYLRPKIAYYYTRRAYAPVIVSFAPEADGVSAWITSDVYSAIGGTFEVALVTFGKGQTKLAEVPVSVNADSSAKVWSASLADIGLIDPTSQCLIGRFLTNGAVTAWNNWFFDIFANVRFPGAKLKVRRQSLDDTRYRLMISASDYARTVAITNIPDTAHPTDNYFDIPPGDEYEVIIEGISGMEGAGVSVELWR